MSSIGAADPIGVLRGVGPTRVRQLGRHGIVTVGDLLLHLPARWVEHPPPVALARAELAEGPIAVIATVEGLVVKRPRGRLTLVEGRLADGDRVLPVVWFNQPWRGSAAPGPWLVRGEVRRWEGRLQMVGPELLPVPSSADGTATAIYPALGELGPAMVARLVESAVESAAAGTMVESIPSALLERRGVPRIGDAIEALHRGPGAVAAVERLVWGELLEHQLLVLARRARRRARPKPHRYRVDATTRAAARSMLPFPLTAAQRRAVAEIVADLEAPGPMARLLHGDVGSGKTLVAALAMLVATESGLQAALLAPTEVLAEQHAATLGRWFGPSRPVALVTGGGTGAAIRQGLADGTIAVAVGTHALLDPEIDFQSLAMVVIDEQHRFGVGQRAALYAKGSRPDLLLMSATPIPRSLALSAFGDLDLSVLDELPPGRAPIETALLPATRRTALERRLGEVLEAGDRAFVVLPRIDAHADADAEAPALEREGARWVEVLGHHGAAAIHGRQDPRRLRAALDDFRAGRIRLLVATSVIEVGLDVPEATWMVIDGAEHFGLAQLHQLRGRVGRGARPGRCVALHGRLGEVAQGRLRAFAAGSDGFALAEADLALRGPGELLGVRQVGSARLRFGDLVRDRERLERARLDAGELLAGPHGASLLAAARAGLVSGLGRRSRGLEAAAADGGGSGSTARLGRSL